MDRQAADNEPAPLYIPLSPIYEQVDSAGNPNPNLNLSPNFPPANDQDTALYADACPDRDPDTSNKPHPQSITLNQEYEEVGVAMTSCDAVAYYNTRAIPGEKVEEASGNKSNSPSRAVYENAAAARQL